MFIKSEEDKKKDVIDMIFNKKRSNDRKTWLENYNRENYLDTNQNNVSYHSFIDKEFIHFSKYDCDRSIPGLMDGLKISLRKILYSGFKRKLTEEIKVAQFAGYVSEVSGYHHGEQSLIGAIINMAQTYVGSNNINIFEPRGQFGTRAKGGNDAASERYIYTCLNNLTRDIYKCEDDNILEYLQDDGLEVEPIYYAPIIPMILVNGTKGIGTGFSTEILQYNPIDLINYLEKKIKKEYIEEECELDPYFEGFKGEIIKINSKKYLIKGKYEIIGNTVHITELPIGLWTQTYIEYLATFLEKKKGENKQNNIIQDFTELCSDTNIDIKITFYPGNINTLLNNKIDEYTNELEKLLKLYNYQTLTNMHLFDANDKLKKYETIYEIIDDYYIKRVELYEKRKKYQLIILEEELKDLSNKCKYILETLEDKIDIRNKSAETINNLLEERNYDKKENSYKYLLKLPMDTVTLENVEKILKEKEEKFNKVKELKEKDIETIWLEELAILKESYKKYKTWRELLQNPDHISKSTKLKEKKIKIK